MQLELHSFFSQAKMETSKYLIIIDMKRMKKKRIDDTSEMHENAQWEKTKFKEYLKNDKVL
jgi:hypothetical protein